jgi:hypothetical protein
VRNISEEGKHNLHHGGSLKLLTLRKMLKEFNQTFFTISIRIRKLSPNPHERPARNLPFSEAGFENHWSAGHLYAVPVQCGLQRRKVVVRVVVTLENQ